MLSSSSRILVLLCVASVFSVAAPQATRAQKFSGVLFSDYSYTLQTDSGEDEGENGFGFRRLFLTGDYDISSDFSVRARLEANDGSNTRENKPAPFVKDLYLKWKNVFGEGHNLEFGITSPPSFAVAERFWGYRSLDKTIQDLAKVVSSRDVGVVARGPLTTSGSIKYGFMIANNSGGSVETDKDKRVYAQLEFYPSNQLAVTVGGDYAGMSGNEIGAMNANAFVGYRSGGVTLGAEGFFNQLERQNASDVDVSGVSLFARARVSPAVEVVGRVDRTMRDSGGGGTWRNYVVAGFSLQPHTKVRFIPNVLIGKNEVDDQAMITGRVTLHADF